MQAQQPTKQEGETVAIDFRTQWQMAKTMSKNGTKVKETTAMNVFNMCQDMRHLIIIDLREESK